MKLQPGDVVRVRTRLHVVEGVEQPSQLGLGTWVRLACIDEDAQGTQSQVLWESELDAEVIRADDWSHVAKRGFDDPRKFAAFLHAQRWNCVTATDARLFQAPFRAGIDIKTFQLEPLRKALALPRVNLFIADDVGLGKTIEAGLILRELLIRQKVQRVVVACPPSVVLQWRDELDQRFGLAFEVYNRDFMSRRRRERGYQVNPWTTHSRFIISHALLRDEDYAGPMRDWLGDFSAGSMLILDEAHNVAPASGSMYAVDSNLTRQLRGLVDRFEHRLFLSATPHNGHSNSFTALLELLDPQRFTRGVPIASTKELEPVMVRRLRTELRQVKGMEQDFPRRDVIPVVVDGLPQDAPELALFDLLEEYRSLRQEKLKTAPKSALNASMLVLTSLQKRLLSSARAFGRTLKVHRRTVDNENKRLAAVDPTPVQRAHLLRGPGSDDGDAELPGLEAEEAHERATEAASSVGAVVPLDNRERELLDRMKDLADAASFTADGRVQKLVAWIRQHMLVNDKWNSRRVLIFTEYLDTQGYLQDCLLQELADTDLVDDRIGSYTGAPPEGGKEKGREAIKAAFNADPDKHPLRILIATDAAREGVNLQNQCADLFHFDIPWNPGRLEQRNGRIDRTLQKSPVVRCHYFIHPQRPADRVLQVLVEKVRTIRDELGSLSSVLDSRVEQALEKGLWKQHLDNHGAYLVQDAVPRDKKDVVLRELEDRTEKLEEQIQRLRGIQQASADEVGFKVGPFMESINVALDMAKAPPLKEASHAAKVEHGTWDFPRLDTADSSWVTSMDALRAPRAPDKKLWEWRKESPIRPVVFRDPGHIDNTTVHLHLEHRLVKRLLGRLLAQGFVRHDIARACVVRAESNIQRVVLLGRLSLYGRGAARLHEEVIPVTARWLEASQRKDGLKAFAEEGQRDVETLSLLEEALTHAAERPVKDAVRSMLRGEAARDVEQLLSVLKARAQEAAADAEKKLSARADKEAKDMATLLESRKARLEKAIREFDEEPVQRELPNMPKDEARQRATERAAWEVRLKQIAAELPREPARVRAGYEVKLVRVEPLGLVYLWPGG